MSGQDLIPVVIMRHFVVSQAQIATRTILQWVVVYVYGVEGGQGWRDNPNTLVIITVFVPCISSDFFLPSSSSSASSIMQQFDPGIYVAPHKHTVHLGEEE